MAVIINELEVILESLGTTPVAAPKPSPLQPPLQLQPMDLRDILEREARAQWRLLAH